MKVGRKPRSRQHPATQGHILDTTKQGCTVNSSMQHTTWQLSHSEQATLTINGSMASTWCSKNLLGTFNSRSNYYLKQILTNWTNIYVEDCPNQNSSPWCKQRGSTHDGRRTRREAPTRQIQTWSQHQWHWQWMLSQPTIQLKRQWMNHPHRSNKGGATHTHG